MKRLFWQDPDPIENNDYVVKTVNGEELHSFNEVYEKFPDLDDDTILLITYNEGCSEAEVTTNELFEIDVDEDLDCIYCGAKCYHGEMCDEQQAGGFN